MKGITPVIAIILLLLITISMVGFAFVWFQRVAQTATESTESQLQSQLSQQAQKIRIESYAGTTVTMRSTGSAAIASGSVGLFVNGSLTTSGTCPASSVAAGAIFSCSSSAAVCSGSSTVRVTSLGNSDQVTC